MKQPQRRSDQIYQRIKNLPAKEQREALLREAAKRGKSPADIVRIIVGMTGLKERDQLPDLAKLWAQIIGVTEQRFLDLGADLLP